MKQTNGKEKKERERTSKNDKKKKKMCKYINSALLFAWFGVPTPIFFHLQTV